MEFKHFKLHGSLACALLLLSIVPVNGSALPFNDDMVANQMRAGSIMKPKSPNSIPVGSLSMRISSAQEAEGMGLTNPKQGNSEAISNGQRLFSVNCAACHGDISKSDWTPGLAGQKFELKQPPNIGSGDFKNRSDASIYSTIHLGFGLMPRLGWKLSADERWDVISYIRSVQAKN